MVVIGEEPHLAYNRVGSNELFPTSQSREPIPQSQRLVLENCRMVTLSYHSEQQGHRNPYFRETGINVQRCDCSLRHIGSRYRF